MGFAGLVRFLLVSYPGGYIVYVGVVRTTSSPVDRSHTFLVGRHSLPIVVIMG